jgi:hypothetical protein
MKPNQHQTQNYRYHYVGQLGYAIISVHLICAEQPFVFHNTSRWLAHLALNCLFNIGPSHCDGAFHQFENSQNYSTQITG